MKKLLLAFAFATTLSVTATIGQAQQIPDPRIADLVQAGKIRVGLFLPQFLEGRSDWGAKGCAGRDCSGACRANWRSDRAAGTCGSTGGRGLPQGQRMRLFVSVPRRSARRRRRLFAPNFPI